MKRLFMVCILFACSIPTRAGSAPLTPADFPYCADIRAMVKAESLYQVHLTDEIIRKAAPGLEDVRLFDSSGRETPSVVINNMPLPEAGETCTLEITGYENTASSAVIFMKLPEKHRPISAINLETTDIDFKKHVSLSGSSDGKTWQPLAEDNIYDFSSQVNLRKTRIEFAQTDFRYFRLTLVDYKPSSGSQPSLRLKYEGLDFSVNGAQKKELRIHSMQGSTATPAEKKPAYDRKIFENLSPALDKDGNTVVVLAAGLPVDQLYLDVANPYYYRTVSLYGSDSGKEDSYRYLASQVIYRFPLSTEQHEERNILEQRAPKHAYYKIVVANRNSPPLEVKGITLSWIQTDLYFIALKSGERYSLCFGNERLTRPDYDIVHFVNRNTLARHAYERVDISPVRTSGGAGPGATGRRAGTEKLLLKIVVVMLVIGMGLWLYVLLKRAPEKK